MMAKSTVKKKQRIAHNKTLLSEDHELFAEDCDILSKIINGMDNNMMLSSIHSNNKFEDSLERNNQKKTVSLPIPNYMSVPKSKKFGLSRKFPLMEKSQRALKQIKHNRTMPKPRAHLAGLSKSPERKSQSFNSSSVSIEKLKKNKTTANSVKNTGSSQKKFTEDPKDRIYSKQQKPSVLKKKNSLEQSSSLVNDSKKQVSPVAKNSSKKSRLENHETVNSSDSDDYEKFIRKEKKDLPKKPQNQKNNTKKPKSTKKISKKRPLKYLSSDSDESDVEIIRKKKRRKNEKKNNKSASIEKSESEMSDEFVSNSCKIHKRKNTVKNKYATIQENESETSDEELVSKSGKRKNAVKNKKSASIQESEYETSDEGLVSKSCKRKNVVENKSASIEESESEIDQIYDEPCNTSSESDDLKPLSQLKNNLQPSHVSFVRELGNNDDSKQQCGWSSPRNSFGASSVGSDQPNVLLKTSDTASQAQLKNNSKQSGLSTHKNLFGASLARHDQPNVLFKSSDTVSLVNSQPKILHEIPKSTSVSQSDVNAVMNSTSISSFQPNVSNKPSSNVSIPCNTYGSSMSMVGNCTKNNLLNVKIKQENTNSSVLIDLVDSDNECNNSFTVVPKIVMTSSQSETQVTTNSAKVDSDEDSEIEMVDVIVHELPKKPKQNVKPNPSNNSGETKIKTEVRQAPLPSNVKTENVQRPSSFKRSQERNDPVFSTGICKKEPIDETLKQSNLKSDKLQTSPAFKEGHSLVLNKVKTEPNEDCQIVFDTVCNSNKSQICGEKQDLKGIKETKANNRPIVSREEKVPLKQKDVDSSNLQNASDTFDAPPKDVAIVKALFDKLKYEFDTYQEIVNTEQSVQSTFKMLQMSQAEKVIHLKAQINKFMSISPGMGEHCSAIKEMSRILDTSELKSQVPPVNISSSDISIQDLKTFASMNIVPLSSIPEEDIKPNVEELQSSLKKEPGTSEEMNKIFLGEKCIVCTKEATAACQQCAKVFFCSNECGKKYWKEGHRDTCAK